MPIIIYGILKRPELVILKKRSYNKNHINIILVRTFLKRPDVTILVLKLRMCLTIHVANVLDKLDKRTNQINDFEI